MHPLTKIAVGFASPFALWYLLYRLRLRAERSARDRSAELFVRAGIVLSLLAAAADLFFGFWRPDPLCAVMGAAWARIAWHDYNEFFI